MGLLVSDILSQTPHSGSNRIFKGFRGIAASKYVVMCASFSAIGGFLFGYELVPHCVSTPIANKSTNVSSHSQGVISVILVMNSFLDRFTEVSDGASGSGFYKGLMTAMITLGAFIGMEQNG